MQKIIFVPDTHVPYENKNAWKLFLKCLDEFQPDKLYILGDFGDFYTTSRHPKDPRRNRDLKWEVDKVNSRLDEIQTRMGTAVHYCLGNHENNLERYLQERAPELFNLVSVPELFQFANREWTWSEYGHIVKCGKLHITHDQDFAGQDAHIRTRDAVGGNVIIGHVHRLSMNYSQSLSGQGHVAVASGWLGEPRFASYMKPSKRKDWFHGFTLGYMMPGGNVHLQIIPFIKNQAIIEGKCVSL